jgi:hypothetical protein
VEALKAEKEALAAQKARLTADVASLETAMHIRREELHDMDRKAEAIERRMLEGVMNQSRMLLLAKGAKAPSPKKKPQGRDLRVPSDASALSAQTVTSSVPALKANHSLAMKSRPTIHRNVPGTADRRIMSLNQINHNVPTGASSALSTTSSLASQGLKRSHSVKTQYQRKPSWASKRDLLAPVENKENDDTLTEEHGEEPRSASPSVYLDDNTSDAGTERRTSLLSRGGSRQVSSSTYDPTTPGLDNESRMSYGTSDLSYGTGSYLTGSEIDRRTSLGSSANGIVGGSAGGVDEVIDEEGEEEEFHEMSEEDLTREAEDVPAPLQIAIPNSKEEEEARRLRYAIGSDSGLGTDLPTAALSSVAGGEYFHR